MNKGWNQVSDIPSKTGDFCTAGAKGDASTLGSRMTSGGKRASQGSKEYLESIIEVMPDRVKANELSEALKFDELKYMLVKQPINDDGILGLTQISEFVL